MCINAVVIITIAIPFFAAGDSIDWSNITLILDRRQRFYSFNQIKAISDIKFLGVTMNIIFFADGTDTQTRILKRFTLH